MKKMKTFILLLSIALIACESDSSYSLNGIENSTDDSNLALKHPTGFSVENPSNPYDFVGQIHNEILNEYIFNVEIKDTTIVGIKNSAKEIALNNENFLEILGDDDFVDMDDNFISAGIADYQNNFSNVIDSLSTGESGKTRLRELLNYVMNFEGTYYEYYDGLFYFEDEILADNKLNVEEKEMILAATSTARYSFDFWFEFIKLDAGGFDYDEVINPTSKNSKGIGILIIVGCDVLGAAGGLIFGGGVPGAVAIGSTASLIGGSIAGGIY